MNSKNKTGIRFVREGNLARVMDKDSELMQFSIGDLYMGGMFIVRSVRFSPGGPRRIANTIDPWLAFVPERHPARVTIRDFPTRHGLRLEIQPDTQGGIADVKNVMEFIPDPDSGGWMIEQSCKVVLRKAVKAAKIKGLLAYPDPQGKTSLWWQIEDPNFECNFGPSVPMKEDWINVLEPNCGPDTFRKYWQRTVEIFFFQEPSGKVRTIRFHRGMLWCLIRQNRCALPFKKGGFGGVLHQDGAATLYEFIDGEPIFGHICEWGFDVHFWRKIKGDPDTLVLPKGHVFETRFRMREVPGKAVQTLLKGARPIEPTREEWKYVEDLPIYEEPVNYFATSWRDRRGADAFPWIGGLGATWDRKVGRTRPGSLKLRMPADQPPEMASVASWKSPGVGVSYFMNPMVPRARYKLSAFVRVQPEGLKPDSAWPSLSVEFHKYAGPATFSHLVEPREIFTSGKPGKIKLNQWTKFEVITGPVTGNVMSATLECRFRGYGQAWFDEVRFEKLDE